MVGSSLSFPISPVISGNFTNGLWNGSVTVLQPASNLVLRADDGSAHTGSSSPFAVALSNDVSIAVVDSPDPVLVGMNLVYALTIANVGPSPATGVIVTNNLPAGATFGLRIGPRFPGPKRTPIRPTTPRRRLPPSQRPRCP